MVAAAMVRHHFGLVELVTHALEGIIRNMAVSDERHLFDPVEGRTLAVGEKWRVPGARARARGPRLPADRAVAQLLFQNTTT